MDSTETEAQKYVWEGAIPLQINLHQSEITTFPPPPPALALAPRMGYLPLLAPQIKPHFCDALPPGVDAVWFEYKGLPLKWHIPTGVLFDLLCAEAERPWNLTVHFRGYPAHIIVPCESEETVKWSFINSLKEAAYIINGSCKNIMNMSQHDQIELWCSVLSGNMGAYLRVSSKLKLGPVEDDFAMKRNSSSQICQQGAADMDAAGQVKTGRVPVRLYVWRVGEDFDDLGDAPQIDSWDKISYINRPVEMPREEGKYLSLHDAMKSLLPEFFPEEPLVGDEITRIDEQRAPSEDRNSTGAGEDVGKEECRLVGSHSPSRKAEIVFIRIQGIEPKPEIPFSWVVNNLMNPEYFLHISVCVKAPQQM